MDFLDVSYWHIAVKLSQKLLQKASDSIIAAAAAELTQQDQANAFGQHCLHIFAVRLTYGANLARRCVFQLVRREGAEGGFAIAL